MSTILKGTFNTIEDNDIYVEIKSPKGLTTYNIGDNEDSDIKFGADPVEIELDCDSLFDHILKKRCTLTLITKVWLGDLFTANDRDVTVVIYKNNEIVFYGYVEPQSFSQPWASSEEEFQMNCVDFLSTLEHHYLTDIASYNTIKKQNNILSFRDFMSMILPTYTYFDMSRLIDNESAIERCGVSMNAFLGDDADDLKNNDKILESMLTFLGVYAIQQGEKILIFDRESIGKQNISFTNIYDGSRINVDVSSINVTNEMHAGDDFNVTMHDVYNRISVKDNFETRDEVIPSLLDSKDIQYYSNYKQLWYSEIISEGEGESAHNAFNSVVQQEHDNFENIVYPDYDAWTREDYYMKWAYNPNWKLMYNGKNIERYLQYSQDGSKVINQQRIMSFLKMNRFMPALVSVGANKNKISNKRPSRLSGGSVVGEIPMTDYLVISVNGNLDDSAAEYEHIDNMMKQACFDTSNGGTTSNYYDECVGLMEYTHESGSFSPADDETTNYLIFSGSMILNPVYRQSGGFSLNGDTLISGVNHYWPNRHDYTFTDTYNMVRGGAWMLTVGVSSNGDGGLYSQQFYKCSDPSTDKETLAPDDLMLYPYVKEDKRQELEYNYSRHWDSEDRIDKLPILVCQMKIGDKYLVETSNGDRNKPTYAWLTYDQCPTYEGHKLTTFTLGIDPEIGDKIVGKEYEISNTVNGRYSNEKGMAIPIKRSDQLSGQVTFKILAVCNSKYNEITRTHPTWFRAESYDDNWKNLLSYVSSIWIKDFDIKIISDNKGMDVSSNNKDLVWYSNVNHDSITEADTVEFELTTQPTTDILVAHNIDSNISNTNVIDMKTNVSVQEIVNARTGDVAIAEHLYIDQQYRWHSKPRAIVECTLLADEIPGLEMRELVMPEFGKMEILSATHTLVDDTVKIRAIQDLNNPNT